MINKYVAMGLGALIALAPVVASVEVAKAATDTSMASPAKGHTGRIAATCTQGNTSAHRARASAHHMHSMRKAPATAPKS